MATSPGKAETGFVALKAAIVAAFPAGEVQRLTYDNLEELEASEQPFGARATFQIIEGDLEKVPPLRKATQVQPQAQGFTLRHWAYDEVKATLPTTHRTQLRTLLNVLEALRDPTTATGSPMLGSGIEFDWLAARRIRGATDVPPYAGDNIEGAFSFTE